MKIEYMDNYEINSLKRFQQEGLGDIEEFYQFYIDSPFCHPLKLTENNQIIAIGSVIIHEDVAWLAHIISSSDYRRKGFGTIITKKLIEISYENSCTTINLIATDLGKKLYKTLGFKEETGYLFFEKKDFKYRFKLSKNIVPCGESFQNQIFKLDKEISTENRAKHLKKVLKNSYVVAISPIIGGSAVSGPAEKFMKAFSLEVSSLGVASLYSGFLDKFIIDEKDKNLKVEIEKLIKDVVITKTIMKNIHEKKMLAKIVLGEEI